MTTIQISKDLKNELEKRKLYDRETYEDVIWDAIETEPLTDQDRKDIEKARKEIKEGKFYTLEEVKEELGL